MMISTVKVMYYRAFGFTVVSTIHLPELVQLHEIQGSPDITIETTDLSQLWISMEAELGKYTVREGNVIFQIPHLGIFYIEHGNKILISPAIGSDKDEIRLYILGSCMGALLLQRKILPLHGSAVVIEGNAYAIVGDSGAGKSTLASAIMKQGYPLLSDDVIAISFSSDQQTAYVTPSYPQQKLWQESMDHFGMESAGYRPLFKRETKFSIPVASNYESKPVPIAGIFELVKTEGEHVAIGRMPSLECLSMLYHHTFRNFLVHRMNLSSWHFDMTAKLVNKLSLYRLERPVSKFTAPDLVSTIITTINRRHIS